MEKKKKDEKKPGNGVVFIVDSQRPGWFFNESRGALTRYHARQFHVWGRFLPSHGQMSE